MEAGLTHLARLSGKQDLTALCSYFYSKNRVKEARYCLPGWKFFLINTHKQAIAWFAGMKVQRYCIFNNCQNNINVTKLSQQAG